MKIYFSKAKQGRTHEMLKDFNKDKSNKIFISDEYTKETFIKQCMRAGETNFDNAVFLSFPSFNLDYLNLLIMDYRDKSNFYIDCSHFVSTIPLNTLKSFECKFNIKLFTTYQQSLNAEGLGVQVIEI